MALDPKIADILDRLQSLETQPLEIDDEWKTRQEWQEAWGVSRQAADNCIKKGLRAGLMERGKRPRQMMNGVVRPTDCYRWTGQ